jgi:hypothetical protein
MVSSSSSTSGTRHATLVTNPWTRTGPVRIVITTNGTHSRVDISLTHRINLHNFVYQYFYSDHHCRYLVTDKAVLYNIYNHTLTVYTYWHLHKDSFIRYLQSYSHSVYVLASSQRQFYTIFTIILSQCIHIGIFTTREFLQRHLFMQNLVIFQ